MPAAHAALFGADGSHLQRYATRFDAAEIDTSFHRPHRPVTYARWAASVGADFRFSVKLPRTITHDARLVGTSALLHGFAAQIGALGDRLGPLLVQLPPSLAFDATVAAAFFDEARAILPGMLCCEPRHASWFDTEADRLLAAWHVARVAADPARVPAAAVPGGWAGLAYWRLHGTPKVYVSEYGAARLRACAEAIGSCDAAERWCILDNTARGAAAGDAAVLKDMMAGR